MSRKAMAVSTALMITILIAAAGFAGTPDPMGQVSHHPAAVEKNGQPKAPADCTGWREPLATHRGMMGGGMTGGGMMSGASMHGTMHSASRPGP